MRQKHKHFATSMERNRSCESSPTMPSAKRSFGATKWTSTCWRAFRFELQLTCSRRRYSEASDMHGICEFRSLGLHEASVTALWSYPADAISQLSSYQKLTKSYDKLSQALRKVKLPLSVVGVTCPSAYYRQTEVCADKFVRHLNAVLFSHSHQRLRLLHEVKLA